MRNTKSKVLQAFEVEQRQEGENRPLIPCFIGLQGIVGQSKPCLFSCQSRGTMTTHLLDHGIEPKTVWEYVMTKTSKQVGG
jgi:hypothetical protein